MWQDGINYIVGKITFGHMTVKQLKNRFYQWGNDWYYYHVDEFG